MSQGTTGLIGGRPGVTPVIRLFSFLLDKAAVRVVVRIEGKTIAAEIHPGEPASPGVARPRCRRATRGTVQSRTSGVLLPLRRIAWGRSGDKGDSANIGLIARRPEYAAVIRDQVTPQRVAQYFAHYLKGDVTRWELPGTHAFNFLLDRRSRRRRHRVAALRPAGQGLRVDAARPARARARRAAGPIR